MRAIWGNQVIVESDETIIVEGNHYFPADSVHKDFFVSSETKTMCSWKGIASYYDIVVDGSTNKDAAWYYPHPSETASRIKNYVAFWRGVEVLE